MELPLGASINIICLERSLQFVEGTERNTGIPRQIETVSGTCRKEGSAIMISGREEQSCTEIKTDAR